MSPSGGDKPPSRDLGLGSIAGRTPPEELQEHAFDPAESSGFFLGVRQFSNDAGLTEIPFAVDDAIDLAWLFAAELAIVRPDRVTLALGGEAQKQSTATKLQHLKGKGARIETASLTRVYQALGEVSAAAGPRGMLICAVATHGFQIDNRDYFLTEDSIRVKLRQTAFMVSDLHADIDKSAAKRQLILIDSCRETIDDAKSRRVGASSVSESLLAELGRVRGGLLLSATGAGGFAYDDPTLGNGVFTAAIIDGLRDGKAAGEDGFVRAANLSQFVNAQVVGWMRTNQPHMAHQAGIHTTISADGGSLPLAIHPARYAVAAEARRAVKERQRLAAEQISSGLKALEELGTTHPDCTAVVWQVRMAMGQGPLPEQLIRRLDRLARERGDYVDDFLAWWEVNGTAPNERRVQERVQPPALPEPPPPPAAPVVPPQPALVEDKAPYIPAAPLVEPLLVSRVTDGSPALVERRIRKRPMVRARYFAYLAVASTITLSSFHCSRTTGNGVPELVAGYLSSVTSLSRAASSVGRPSPAVTEPIVTPTPTPTPGPKPIPKVVLGVGDVRGEIRSVPISSGASLRMVWVPPGIFVMGSPLEEAGRDPDEEQFSVKISKGFWISAFEITASQWNAVLGSFPPDQREGDRPVVNVSWIMIMGLQEDPFSKPGRGGFISQLNKATGLSFNLPTEAQWEYACRAGNTGAFSPVRPRMSEVGWTKVNSSGALHEVGGLAPNAWGVYDMHGNAWEWCLDNSAPYPQVAVVDWVHFEAHETRIVRGGSVTSAAAAARSANRHELRQTATGPSYGFRVVLVP